MDCFTKFPLKELDYIRLKDSGFKICIVSPELQGRDADTEITNMSTQLKDLNIVPDAVCTKRPDIWENLDI